ncbi:MAG: pyridoxamine 5-phosphate oxidase [Rhodospirillales bacterium]|jgi:general stress protein 26|nr:pyridoxamine 5-phosphate oxidase [Rhodospirillales bacterium]
MHDEEEGAADTAERAKLFEMIKDVDTTMMTTVDEDGALRSRPMGNRQADTFDGTLWFLTRASSHKVLELQETDEVNLAYASPEKHTYVSVSGRARLVRDRSRARQLWSSSLKVWFPQGLDDPDLALLRVDVEKAEYWDAPSSTMLHLFGKAKAALTGKPSEGGENKKLKLAAE